VKSRIYANEPKKKKKIPELKAEIRRVVGEIEPQLCGNVIESFVKRARACQQSREGYLLDVLFHN
jgi:peptidoglycan hydrolase CwlO-like protein